MQRVIVSKIGFRGLLNFKKSHQMKNPFNFGSSYRKQIEHTKFLDKNNITAKIINHFGSIKQDIKASNEKFPQTISNKQYRLPYQEQNIAILRNFVHTFYLNQNVLKDDLKNNFSEIYRKKVESFSINKSASNLKNAQTQFKSVQGELKTLYEYIKNVIISDDEIADADFKRQSEYYFTKQGKKVRPMLIYMIANFIAQNTNSKSHKIYETTKLKIQRWAGLIEIMHIASLAHDDIIDDSPSRRGQQSQHIKYGKRNAVFSGNFIISKASQAIYDFKSPQLFRIYSIAMDDLAGGEIIQILTKNSIGDSNYNNASKPQSIDDKIGKVIKALEIYMNKTYYKTAALMSNSLRAVPHLFKQNFTNLQNFPVKQIELKAFRVGQHLGIAFQIVDDILDYTSTSEEMGKQAMSDLLGGNITAPVYLSLLQQYVKMKNSQPNHLASGSYESSQKIDRIQAILLKKKKEVSEVNMIKDWVMQQGGVQASLVLALNHIQSAFIYLKQLQACICGQKNGQRNNFRVWQYLGTKIVNRRS